jgi:hypothetical protein
MLIGKKLAHAARIVPLAVGLITVAGPATAAHAASTPPPPPLCEVPFIINDPAPLADDEILSFGLRPHLFLRFDQSLPLSAYIVAATSPAFGHLVTCGSTVTYSVKLIPEGGMP